MPYAQAGKAELYYEEQGTGDPLLLIMGLGVTHAGWVLQAPAFRKQHRVITYDSRGLGLSADDGEPYTIRTLADDAVALLDHLGIERSHVLGLSLGGMVAQEVAINYPGRVHRLVLVATTPGGARLEVTPEMRHALGIGPDVDLGSIEAGEVQIDMKEVGASMTRLSFNNPLLSWALMKLARSRGNPASPEGTHRQAQAASAVDTVGRLHLIQAPTLVMAGTKDRIVPPHASEVLASRIPNARLALLKGASHAFAIEASWRLNQEVLRFLKA